MCDNGLFRMVFRTLFRPLSLLAAGCVMLIAPVAAHAATPEEVDQAVARGIAYLYSQQHKDKGHWEVVETRDRNKDKADVANGQWGGQTAIATCALLYAKESPQDPRIKRAVDWLVRADVYGIYAMGFRCQVWAMVPNHPGVRQVAREDLNYLLNSIIVSGTYQVGMFPYYWTTNAKEQPPKDFQNQVWYDHSVSQYGLLALWSLEQLQVEVPTKAWRVMDEGWRRNQGRNGGWAYRVEDSNADWNSENISMTAAGVASLYITQDKLYLSKNLNCTTSPRDVHLERGLRYLADNFDDYKKKWPYYAAYGIERIGVAGGHKYLGTRDWYKEISEFLVRRQNPDGSWGGDDTHYNAKKVPDTCFALMALLRGRAPVVVNKLEYASAPPAKSASMPAGSVSPLRVGERPSIRPGSTSAASGRVSPTLPATASTWNQRPRDVANLTRWMSKQMERDLNWQVVNLDVPVTELHDAPILWISGRDALKFSAEHQAKLKQFVQQGGLIVGHADCGSKAFADSFNKLGQALFASEFRELPEGHPIYQHQQYRRASWKNPPRVLGLSNGARELMLLIPIHDPARGWQVNSFLGSDKEVSAQLMTNIFLYAVDKRNLRTKGETYLVQDDPKASIKHKVKLARLGYSGNWDPEPGGWIRLGSILRNTRSMELKTESVRLGEGALTASAFPIAHLTGTTKFRLTEAELNELRRFVNEGGTLIIDACGGSADFAVSVEEQLGTLFPGVKANTLEKEHPVFSAGQKISDVQYRPYARRTLGNDVHGPRIRGLEFDGRTRVFVSQEDLSLGLVGTPVDGVHGYDSKSAAALMSNIITFATVGARN